MHSTPPASRVGPSPRPTDAPPVISSPRRGPPATTTTNTPCSRPRRWSGVADCRIEPRKTPESESAAPPTAMHSAARANASVRRGSPSGRDCAHHTTPPNAATAAPHTRIETYTPQPCACRRVNGAENSPARNAPAAIAASSTPTAASPPPSTTAPMAGSRARGNAVVMATMSARKVIRRFGREPRKRRPSTTEARPPRVPEAAAASPRCGGRDGSRHTAYRAARKVTTSIE